MASAEDVVARVRKTALDRGANGIRGLARMFRIFDDNGCKKLDFEEFKYGLRDYGCDVSEQECRTLFSHFDADRNGSINFDEFLRVLRPPLSPQRVKMIKLAFKKIDATGDNIITVEDLARNYNPDQHPKYKSGEWSKKKVFQEFLNNFQVGSSEVDEKVTWDEWLNYYCGVSASIDQDVYFDYMMRQCWKL